MDLPIYSAHDFYVLPPKAESKLKKISKDPPNLKTVLYIGQKWKMSDVISWGRGWG